MPTPNIDTKVQSETLEQILCECGHIFDEHVKPNRDVSWDICSFPCSGCECQEFTQKEIA